MSGFKDKMIGYLRVVDDLPALPAIVFELERALQDETYGATEVAFIIEEDVTLTANILKTVNSAFFGSRGTISSVREAVARLGSKEIRRLATTFGVLRAFHDVGPHLDPIPFWKHSLLVGLAARATVENMRGNPFLEEEAYTAGLLHDVGVLILDQYFPDEYVQVAERLNGVDTPRAETERAVLGIDHGEIGSYLLDVWNLPEDIVESVQWHHQLERAPEHERIQARTLLFADTVAKRMESGDNGREEIERAAETLLEIEPKTVAAILDAVRKEQRLSQAILG